MRYLVSVDGREFELDVNDGEVSLDGVALEASLEMCGADSAVLRIGRRAHRILFTRVRSGPGPGTPGRATHSVWVNGHRYEVVSRDERALALEKLAAARGVRQSALPVVAPMPGLIVAVRVSVGETVAAGQGVLVMEAMKMENELRAGAAGVVRQIHVVAGRAVEKGTLLVEFE